MGSVMAGLRGDCPGASRYGKRPGVDKRGRWSARGVFARRGDEDPVVGTVGVSRSRLSQPSATTTLRSSTCPPCPLLDHASWLTRVRSTEANLSFGPPANSTRRTPASQSETAEPLPGRTSTPPRPVMDGTLGPMAGVVVSARDAHAHRAAIDVQTTPEFHLTCHETLA